MPMLEDMNERMLQNVTPQWFNGHAAIAVYSVIAEHVKGAYTSFQRVKTLLFSPCPQKKKKKSEISVLFASQFGVFEMI